MKLSTKGRYGLKAMVELAEHYNSECVSTCRLAESQGISEAYLERILGALKKSGLVNSTRGSQGGYTLSKPPEEVSVGEILRELEGSTNLVDCVDGKIQKFCSDACTCSARPLWLKLQARIDEVLFTTTLRDMADDHAAQRKFINDRQKH